jgi:hypothetical protein
MRNFIDINAIQLGNSGGSGSGSGGSGGGGVSIQSYTHTQSTAEMVWNVQHNFGTLDTLYVTVRDSDGNLVECEADYPSSTANLLVLRFGVATAGVATVKKI